MTKIKLVPLFFFLFHFISCNVNETDVIGLYVSRNNINTIDTIRIQNDGKYINVLYRKTDNSLIYRNIGKWHVNNSYITFEKFFPDADDMHSKSFSKYEEVLITTMLPLEKVDGRIIIHHIPGYDHIYLEKIK